MTMDKCMQTSRVAYIYYCTCAQS